MYNLYNVMCLWSELWTLLQKSYQAPSRPSATGQAKIMPEIPSARANNRPEWPDAANDESETWGVSRFSLPLLLRLSHGPPASESLLVSCFGVDASQPFVFLL